MYAVVRGKRRRDEAVLQETVLRERVAFVHMQMAAAITEKLLRLALVERHYLTRPALCRPEDSAWACIVQSGNDMAYLEVTALTLRAFEILHDSFGPCLEQHWNALRATGKPQGRKRKMTTWCVLGMTLAWFHRPYECSDLALIFGQVPACVTRYLQEGKNTLLSILPTMRLARIAWPSPTKMARHASRIQRVQPSLPGCFGFVDGLNIAIQDPSEPEEQTAYYNGKCNHLC